MVSVLFAGGDEGDRTLDLLNAIQTRSQLRYAPEFTKILYYRPPGDFKGISCGICKKFFRIINKLDQSPGESLEAENKV